MRVLTITAVLLISSALAPRLRSRRKSPPFLINRRSPLFNQSVPLSHRSSPGNKIGNQRTMSGWVAIGECSNAMPIGWGEWIRGARIKTAWGG